MLSSLTLKFTENANITLPATGITVFVGPNNSGKSLALREIERLFIESPTPSDFRIIHDFEIDWPSTEQFESTISRYKIRSPKNSKPDQLYLGRLSPNKGVENTQIGRQQITSMLENKNDKSWWTSQIDRWGMIRLDGRSRFDLTKDQNGGDLLAQPQNILAHLFQDDVARLRVRSAIYDAFELNFVIDPTQRSSLRIRLSANNVLADEQSLNAAARTFHSSAIYIGDASDGIQAFTGITMAVLSGDYHTIIIDEPEAFLHPPLSRKLGKNLAKLVAEKSGSLMASTHSPDFLMGCIQVNNDVKIVRLEYRNGKSSGKVVDPKKINDLFKRPLLRSANVISALFYDGVIVTESDNDRAIYGEIYNRLNDEIGNLPSILFVNAQNKQTIKDIVGPLREFGVPAAAIVDIDVLKDGGKIWTDWLTAVRMPELLHDGCANQRAALKGRLEANGRNMKSDGGVKILAEDDRKAADQLFNVLADYGMFVVRRGELENWLPELGITGKKTDWTVNMLDKLGSEPSRPDYIRPKETDVWEFIRTIIAWIGNPSRIGT